MYICNMYVQTVYTPHENRRGCWGVRGNGGGPIQARYNYICIYIKCHNKTPYSVWELEKLIRVFYRIAVHRECDIIIRKLMYHQLC